MAAADRTVYAAEAGHRTAKTGRSYLVQGQLSMLSYVEHRTIGQDRRGISAFVHPLMAGRAALCQNRVRTL